MNIIDPKYPNDPEQTMWLTTAKNCDSLAFNHIGEEYRQPIYNFCDGVLKNGDEAEDGPGYHSDWPQLLTYRVRIETMR